MDSVARLKGVFKVDGTDPELVRSQMQAFVTSGSPALLHAGGQYDGRGRYAHLVRTGMARHLLPACAVRGLRDPLRPLVALPAHDAHP